MLVMDEHRSLPIQATAAELTEAGTGVADDGARPTVRSAISDAMVGIKKKYYGKGPERAKTFINDEYVFCVMEGGLTRNEETLLAAGQENLVREYRLRFQEAMATTMTTAVAELTDRAVVGYHSQILFDPPRSIEIFVLDPPL
jgi:uncharacterized protein YbcI